ncbi:MAG: hypothetical protein ACPGVO_17220 [Spirulinaceae cyanobacterium]
MEKLASQVAEKMQVLPSEKQREVLDFVEFLVSRTTVQYENRYNDFQIYRKHRDQVIPTIMP